MAILSLLGVLFLFNATSCKNHETPFFLASANEAVGGISPTTAVQ